MRARRIDAATLAVACHRQSHRPLSHSGQKNRHSGQNRHGGQKNTECAIWNDRNDTMKAYEAIAQSLIAEGVTDFFGLMGDGNMWLWCALCRNPDDQAIQCAPRIHGRLDGRRLHPHHWQGRRRDGHLRAGPDAVRHLADRRLSRQDAAGADRRRDPAGRQEQDPVDGPAPIRRGQLRAVLHRHQSRQHGRGNRRGVLCGAHPPRSRHAQPADAPAGRTSSTGTTTIVPPRSSCRRAWKRRAPTCWRR